MLLHRVGPLCRNGVLAAALGFGAALTATDAIARAEGPADSESRASASVETHEAEKHEARRPGGSALADPGHRAPSTLSRGPVSNRLRIPVLDNPIPEVRRTGPHVGVGGSDTRASVRSAVIAAATVQGQGPSAVVGPAPVASSALTQSLIQSTGGLKGTVLGLDPAFFPVMGIWMDGFATSNGRTFRRVWYPNIPSLMNSELGVAALDKSLHETPGLKIVFGHSMGAQVASKWLREKGPTSDIPASDVVFVLGGNPERKYGGALLVPAKPKLWGFWPIQPTYGGPGIPDDTPYTVIDYARQYDWWADAPTVLTPSRTAQNNASQAIHSNYFSVGIDDSDVLTYVEGNRIYKLKATTIDAAKRAVVEQSYSRPTGADQSSSSWAATSSGMSMLV